MLHTSLKLDPECRQEGMRLHWLVRGLFGKVEWEDVGISDTVLDSRNTLAHAARMDELQDLIGSHLEAVANEMLLRTDAWDPRLQDMLHTALLRFEGHFSAEGLR